MRIGYFLSSEELHPGRADRAGQAAPSGPASRHCGSPTTTTRGSTRRDRAPFVWSMIGALSQACSLPITTAVTCPTVRIHPAVIAQAAATSAVLTGGRFRLGVGTGEALNEHIFGDAWPEAEVRLEMLEEAVEIMRGLWKGGNYSHHGKHYTVENARIYTLPGDAGGDPDLRVRPEGHVAGRPDRRRLRQHHAGRRPGRRSSAGGRRRARWPRPDSRRRTPTPRTRARGSRTRNGRTPACPVSCPRCCRHRSTSSRPPSWSPRTWSRRASSAATTRTPTWR